MRASLASISDNRQRVLLNRHKDLAGRDRRRHALAAVGTTRGTMATNAKKRATAAASGASVPPVYLLQAALRNWARAVAEKRRTLGGRSGRIIRLIW